MMYNYNKSDTAYIRSFRLAALMEESNVGLSAWTPFQRQVEGHREQKSLGQVDLCRSSRTTAWRAAFPSANMSFNFRLDNYFRCWFFQCVHQRGDKGYAVMSEGIWRSDNPLPDAMMSLRRRLARRYQMRANIQLLLVLAVVKTRLTNWSETCSFHKDQ